MDANLAQLLAAIAAARVAHTNAESAIFAAAIGGQSVDSLEPHIEELIDADSKLVEDLRALLKVL